MPRALSQLKTSPPLYVTSMDYLKGVDLTSSPINVALGRAYDAPNMIREVPGKVRKRMGYYVHCQYPDRINGIFQYFDTRLVHSGTKLYKEYTTTDERGNPKIVFEEIGGGLPDALSNAYIIGRKMIILTGTTMFCYYEDGDVIYFNTAEHFADENPPIVTVGRPPKGGGDTYQFNMLTSKYTDSFLSNSTDATYQLSYAPIKPMSVHVQILNNNDEWIDYPGTYLTLYDVGTVTFDNPIGDPPVSGEDNVRITAEVADTTEMKRKVNGCTFGILYGFRGLMDRIFISGNPEFPNNDWFCAVNDPLFWGDASYGQIGKQDSAITGYSIIDGKLATHKADDDDGRNIFVREGELDLETEDLLPVEFPITAVIQGMGAVAPGSFAYLHEPLYLTNDGIYATTPYEFNGRWYAQKRSYYLDGKLLKEANKENAIACVWKDFYCLATGRNVYILDTLQKDGAGVIRSSEFQYEGYYFTNIPVRKWFVEPERLMFGAQDGCIYAFHTQKMASQSYNDAGGAIPARWDFVHTGTNLYLDKTSWWISMLLECTSRSSIALYYRKSNEAEFNDMYVNGTFRYFDYGFISYPDFFYGSSDSAVTFGHKLKIKRYDYCRFSLRNYHLNEGLFIYAITLEFEEGRNYKTLRG